MKVCKGCREEYKVVGDYYGCDNCGHDEWEEIMFTVSYIGMDHQEYSEELATLELAMTFATEVEELGAQCVTITDPLGEEVIF